MEDIGRLIKLLREHSNITQKELSEGICSQKYVYLIEKGERTASLTVLEQFSHRLNLNILEYFPYQNCDDPISIKNFISDFARYQRESNFKAVLELITEAIKYRDFEKYPWKIIIDSNKLLCDVFIKQKFFESDERIDELIRNVPAEYKNHEYVVHLHMLKSIINQIIGNLEFSSRSVNQAEEILKSNNLYVNNPQLAVTVRLNSLILRYLKGEYISAIDEGNFLLDYQNRKKFLR